MGNVLRFIGWWFLFGIVTFWLILLLGGGRSLGNWGSFMTWPFALFIVIRRAQRRASSTASQL